MWSSSDEPIWSHSFMGLRRFFQIEDKAPEYEQVVVAEANGLRIGFGVDRFIGQHQTVIKSLGKAYEGIREISGATILGDGTVALILDIPQLVDTMAANDFNFDRL
jgi:two-component system, chemotaxis family, sensor kinase CheA